MGSDHDDGIKFAYFVPAKNKEKFIELRKVIKPAEGEWIQFLLRAHQAGLIRVLGPTAEDPKNLLARLQEFGSFTLADEREYTGEGTDNVD